MAGQHNPTVNVYFTHMYKGGSVADFFFTPWLQMSPGDCKKSATELLIIHVCEGKNAAYVTTKNELLFATQNIFLLKKCGVSIKNAQRKRKTDSRIC